MRMRADPRYIFMLDLAAPALAGFAVLAPIVPTLMTNFMASRRAGYSMACEDFPPTKQPPECQDAYSDVVFWSSASSFISNGMTFLLVRSSSSLACTQSLSKSACRSLCSETGAQGCLCSSVAGASGGAVERRARPQAVHALGYGI